MHAFPNLRSFRIYVPGAVAVAALLGLGAAPAVPANYSGATSAGSGTTQVPGPSDNDVFNAPVPDTVSSSSVAAAGTSTSGERGFSNSFAGASGAAVAVTATAGAQAANVNPGSAGAQAAASATATFSDVFGLNAAGFTQGTVRMSFGLVVAGTFGGNGSIVGGGSASWSGNVSWRAAAQVGSFSVEQGQSLFRNSSGAFTLTGDGLFGLSVYTIDVPLGLTSVQLRVEAAASSSASTDFFAASAAESAFSSHLGNTVRWGGILGLSTLDNIAITDFTALSASSGVDYAQATPVPEPEAWAMMLSGLLVMGAAARRRCNRREG